jgi:hypothetical protein
MGYGAGVGFEFEDGFYNKFESGELSLNATKVLREHNRTLLIPLREEDEQSAFFDDVIAKLILDTLKVKRKGAVTLCLEGWEGRSGWLDAHVELEMQERCVRDQRFEFDNLTLAKNMSRWMCENYDFTEDIVFHCGIQVQGIENFVYGPGYCRWDFDGATECDVRVYVEVWATTGFKDTVVYHDFSNEVVGASAQFCGVVVAAYAGLGDDYIAQYAEKEYGDDLEDDEE